MSLIILTEWLIQFSCDNTALLKATVDSKLFILHCTEMMAWQRSSDNSMTESFVQQSNRPAKLDRVVTRFHKLDKPNYFHQMEDPIAIFKIEHFNRVLNRKDSKVRKHIHVCSLILTLH